MPRGRTRKNNSNGNGDHISDAAIAVLEKMERPQLDVEVLRTAQAVRVKVFTDSLSENRRPPEGERELVLRVIEWYATPYEWREHKTEATICEHLRITPMKLRLLRSMYLDGIEMAADEIRRSMKLHGKLMFPDVFAGVIEAAKTNAPMYDRYKSEAFGDDVPGVNVNVGVQVNVEEVHNRLMEKLGVSDL